MTREKKQLFIQNIVEVCLAHGLWIGHEDEHGAFVIQEASTEDWLLQATSEELDTRGERI